MAQLTKKEIQHLYSRAGFALRPDEIAKEFGKSRKEVVSALMKSSSSVSNLYVKIPSIMKEDKKGLSAEQKKKLRKDKRLKILEINQNWVKRLGLTDEVLREKMTLFWHDHFACHSKEPVLALQLNNIIRKNALGKFKDLLLEVSKSPAIILYLHNQQNKKKHPNEDFAREVMELFTLGRDNGYTEDDIKEAARAFTGWRTDKKGAFIFEEKFHDEGEKVIFGKTGNFKGEDVIDMLVQKRETSLYIVTKLYKYFVNPRVDEKRVEQLADKFYETDLNIEELMEYIFESEWFYDQGNIGIKIKSPVELIVGINRMFNVKYEDPQAIITMQQMLNQVLFHPPNVAGWSGDKAWIDNSSITLRLLLPALLLNDAVIEYWDKEGIPATYQEAINKEVLKNKKKYHKILKANTNWDNYLKKVEELTQTEVQDLFLLCKYSTAASAMLSKMNFNYRKDFIIQVMSLPEYQLC